MLLLSRLTLVTLIIVYSPLSFGNDPDSATLALGSVLNDKGQPIELPDKPKSDFNYSPPPIEDSKRSSTQSRVTKKSSSKKAKAKSRKQRLASRSSVANDPGCRWLNSRMNSLDRHLSSGVNSRNRHYQTELKIRQGEWECMKCGAEGPEQSDHATCQYRR
ncbi:hypothetical protein L2719_10235 [Shewanella schlegeliana]|uniref:Secreted protein n=1 Tax=Shewanella schlegeliana TaxID=190308 RepID=A0ABS1T1S0_9GAMM|nr:hypothetical protein [Shewanella schlegeliana]MBL4914743.1 hypothetical protein [Shewanella schlegeliana]MCL1109925.1 hypothetical protein [Shewanella schlegeliana]GIU25623.1 hypothetical protein TUM4433_10610 [Shewanella schlegeliana]